MLVSSLVVVILSLTYAADSTINGAALKNDGENVHRCETHTEKKTSKLIEKIPIFKKLLAELHTEDEKSSSYFWIVGEIESKKGEIEPKKEEQEKPVEGCCKPKPSSCADIQGMLTVKKSGVYTIYPKRLQFQSQNSVEVYCDLETNGGEWTVIQRREDYGTPRENFTRTWADYKKGFGNVTREFWLGNDIINALTSQDNVVLRIDMESFESEKRYAEYEYFRVKREEQKYQLTVGPYRGTAGDSLYIRHNTMFFTTFDFDNDIEASANCANAYKGGWWYDKCHLSNLNGIYHLGKQESYADGVNWHSWKGYHYSLKTVEMKIRPV